MGKVTVKHYLNKRAKPVIKDGKECYPVYVRVIHNRQNTNYKTEIISNYILDEKAFELDDVVRQEINYETDLIFSIIDYGIEHIADKFTINRMFEYVSLFNHDLKLLFLDLIDNECFRNDVANYIVKKTDFKIDTVLHLITHNLPIGDSLAEIVDLGILNKYESDKLKYYLVLQDFSDKFYPEPSKWGANKNFCFFLWKFRNGKSKFISYITEKNILTTKEIDRITKDFEKEISERVEFEMTYNVSRSTRN